MCVQTQRSMKEAVQVGCANLDKLPEELRLQSALATESRGSCSSGIRVEIIIIISNSFWALRVIPGPSIFMELKLLVVWTTIGSQYYFIILV